MKPTRIFSSTPQHGSDRAVSPVVGVVLIIAFTVLIGVALFLFAQGIIVDNNNPRVDAEFTLEYESKTEIFLVYTDGDTFTPQDTGRLYITGNDANGSEYELTIHNGTAVVDPYYSSPPSELKEGMIAVGKNRTQDSDIKSGATIQVIWQPADRPNTQIVLDEKVVPDEEAIVSQVSTGGDISFTAGDITFGGCDPATSTCPQTEGNISFGGGDITFGGCDTRTETCT